MFIHTHIHAYTQTGNFSKWLVKDGKPIKRYGKCNKRRRKRERICVACICMYVHTHTHSRTHTHTHTHVNTGPNEKPESFEKDIEEALK